VAGIGVGTLGGSVTKLGGIGVSLSTDDACDGCVGGVVGTFVGTCVGGRVGCSVVLDVGGFVIGCTGRDVAGSLVGSLVGSLDGTFVSDCAGFDVAVSVVGGVTATKIWQDPTVRSKTPRQAPTFMLFPAPSTKVSEPSSETKDIQKKVTKYGNFVTTECTT
jgi:hypothetical protein